MPPKSQGVHPPYQDVGAGEPLLSDSSAIHTLKATTQKLWGPLSTLSSWKGSSSLRALKVHKIHELFMQPNPRPGFERCDRPQEMSPSSRSPQSYAFT